MATARTVAASEIITSVLYGLRDPNGSNYNKDGGYAELLGYINRCLEMIYEALVDEESELIRTGTGTITTVAGTQSYDLSANGMGDLWVPQRVWVSEYPAMEMCMESELYDAINANEGSSTSQAQPDAYCIVDDILWFKDVPDAVYTVNLRYFPNFIPLSATTGTMPYKNLFNNDIIEGTKLFARHRNEMGINVEAALHSRFQQRALRLTRKRRAKPASITPGLR